MNYCGVDISTNRIGVTIIDDDENIVACKTELLTLMKTHKERRVFVANVISCFVEEFKVSKIAVEEVRLFSFGGRNFINFKTIFRLIGCTIAIIDAVNIPVYSVNSKSVKSRILSYVKSQVDKKTAAVNFVENNYGIVVNHDLADSICIALFVKRHFDKCKLLE